MVPLYTVQSVAPTYSSSPAQQTPRDENGSIVNEDIYYSLMEKLPNLRLLLITNVVIGPSTYLLVNCMVPPKNLFVLDTSKLSLCLAQDNLDRTRYGPLTMANEFAYIERKNTHVNVDKLYRKEKHTNK